MSWSISEEPGGRGKHAGLSLHQDDPKQLNLWRPDTQVCRQLPVSYTITITNTVFERREFSLCRGRHGRMIELIGPFALYRDHFNLLDLFAGECQLFGLEVFCHMFWARSSSQRQHAALHGEPENDLRGSGA